MPKPTELPDDVDDLGHVFARRDTPQTNDLRLFLGPGLYRKLAWNRREDNTRSDVVTGLEEGRNVVGVGERQVAAQALQRRPADPRTARAVELQESRQPVEPTIVYLRARRIGPGKVDILYPPCGEAEF